MSAQPFVIGRGQGTTAAAWFQGYLDEVRVYNRRRSTGEVTGLVSQGGSVIVKD